MNFMMHLQRNISVAWFMDAIFNEISKKKKKSRKNAQFRLKK